jgi:hypothetical protein
MNNMSKIHQNQSPFVQIPRELHDSRNLDGSTLGGNPSNSRGFFDSIIQQLSSAFLKKDAPDSSESASTGPFGPGTAVKSLLSGDQMQGQGQGQRQGQGQGQRQGQTTGFDWKTRAIHICDQVKARGFNEIEFGCLNNHDDVSKDFSWRGYAKMVCSRIATIYDPSVPEMCGCPPPTWPGWRP